MIPGGAASPGRAASAKGPGLCRIHIAQIGKVGNPGPGFPTDKGKPRRGFPAFASPSLRRDHFDLIHYRSV
ncbi:MAG: hypothetical protein SNJ52_03175, partial [Verrucomicrobiia bacterium]